jgi:CSLREA domain-containing protein
MMHRKILLQAFSRLRSGAAHRRLPAGLSAAALLLFAAACIPVSGDLVVNSTGDAGDSSPGDKICRTAASASECTLRAAIQEANAWTGANTIKFDIPGGSLTIAPGSVLPDITEEVVIDATTQPGYVHRITMVTLDGSGLTVPPTLDGLTVAPGIPVTMKGMIIMGFPDSGISNRGVLILEEMSVSQNRDTGLASGGGASVLPLTISDSDFSDNRAAGVSSNMNDVTVTGGIISGNGGGIGVSNGSLNMTGTEIRDNTGWALHPFGGVGLSYSNASLTDVLIESNESHDYGGGIEFTGSGSHTLTVFNSILRSNLAYHGGGIEVLGGTVHLNQTLLLNNIALIDGGAVRVRPSGTGPTTLYVENGSAIGNFPGHGNTADYDTSDTQIGRGGGIYSEADVEITDSFVEGNSKEGIYNNGGALRLQHTDVYANEMDGIVSTSPAASPSTVYIHSSSIFSNSETGIDARNANLSVIGSSIFENNEGGLQMEGGSLDLSYSTVARNDLLTDPSPGGGVGLRSMGNVLIQSTTISGNHSSANGGGLYIQARSGLVQNTTISGNRTSNAGGGIAAAGDAIILLNVTVSGNIGLTSGGILGDDRLTVLNTIVAENTPFNCGGPAPFVSGGYNLDDGATCGFTAAGDISGVPALLGPLQDNGGPTHTHALLPGSPAIDAANDATAPPTDQRYILRPQGPHSDIGAFEVISEDATPTSTPTGRRTPEGFTRTPPLSPILFDPVEFSSEILYKGQGCEPLTLTIRVHITPPEEVASVGLFYRLTAKEGGQSFPWSEGLAMSPQGDGWYGLTLIGDDLPNIYEWQSGAWLDFQFVANGPEGEVIARSEVIRKVVYAMCRGYNNY